MELLTYYDAKRLFWIRTFIWFIPVSIVIMGLFFVFGCRDIDIISLKANISFFGAILSVLIAFFSTLITLQLPWMRLGWKFSFLIESPVCAIFSGIITFFVCGIILNFMISAAPDAGAYPEKYSAYTNNISIAWFVAIFTIGITSLTGFICGLWFSLRHDKYFIEQI